ncbi:hypothetical protein FC26_GL001456 [Paucilactobacillus vaccinostercus DSM 20634]|uniref:Uncharacterized protein n=1 Tax=Paucilactobacillus vaccinostercus DSM 20634 TaxID=1423813 RepID=A0A0R2ACC2_9LACO|nr:hypothetical protein [Paucilactobacillus vaccinostercus]KRM61385.1 hypothetical protein FC26_GL001456 [Paucilactobacillus vaccinostercus DSM 20634]
MEAWLIPISFFSKRYFSINTLAIFPIAIYTLMLAYVIVTKHDSLSLIKFPKKALYFVLLFLLSQTAVDFFYFSKVKNDPGSPNLISGVFFGVYAVCFNIVVVALLVKFLISYSENAKYHFIKSFYISFCLLGLIVLLPQLLVVLTNFGSSWVNLIGRFFEERHAGRGDFYFMGSYTTTLRRINGLCSEASFLAAQLGIVFIPVLLASLKNRFNIFNGTRDNTGILNWILLIFVWIILLFAKTSTGILVIFLSLLIMFFFEKMDRKVLYFVLGIIAMFGVVAAYFTIQPIREIVNKYLLHKSGVSNRLGGTIGLIITFLHYPIFGVGNAYESYYLMKFVPKSTTNNWEFQDVFRQTGYPVQSEFFSFFAHFGLIIMIPFLIYIVRKILLAHNLKKNITNSRETNKEDLFHLTIIDAFYYFLIMYLCISFFSFGWFDNYYLVIFFFYLTVINNYANKRGIL